MGNTQELFASDSLTITAYSNNGKPDYVVFKASESAESHAAYLKQGLTLEAYRIGLAIGYAATHERRVSFQEHAFRLYSEEGWRDTFHAIDVMHERGWLNEAQCALAQKRLVDLEYPTSRTYPHTTPLLVKDGLTVDAVTQTDGTVSVTVFTTHWNALKELVVNARLDASRANYLDPVEAEGYRPMTAFTFSARPSEQEAFMIHITDALLEQGLVTFRERDHVWRWLNDLRTSAPSPGNTRPLNAAADLPPELETQHLPVLPGNAADVATQQAFDSSLAQSAATQHA